MLARVLNALIRTAFRIGFHFAQLYWRVTRPAVSGSYVFVRRAADDEGGSELLLARNSYRRGLTVPGGGLDAGESPRAAARRELREETGLDLVAERFEPLCDFVMDHLHRRDHVHFFLVDLAAVEHCAPEIDQREVAWAAFVRRNAIERDELVPPLQRFVEEQRNSVGAAGSIARWLAP